MSWSQPHISKIYEALGAIGDKRIEIAPDKNEAHIYSSSRNKFYTVTWNDDFTQMMANDNSAYFQGKLSYPMIAVLMLKNKIAYPEDLSLLLQGIEWKILNKKFKNDFDKTVDFVLSNLQHLGIDSELIKKEIATIQDQVAKLQIEPFGKRVRPPLGD